MSNEPKIRTSPYIRSFLSIAGLYGPYYRVVLTIALLQYEPRDYGWLDHKGRLVVLEGKGHLVVLDKVPIRHRSQFTQAPSTSSSTTETITLNSMTQTCDSSH